MNISGVSINEPFKRSNRGSKVMFNVNFQYNNDESNHHQKLNEDIKDQCSMLLNHLMYLYGGSIEDTTYVLKNIGGIMEECANEILTQKRIDFLGAMPI